MREIKFRGKRVDNGEWVYGYYVHSNKDLIHEGDYGNIWVVIQETVGQFTGLKDENDKEIYEGDIVNCSRGCPHKIYFEQEYAGTYIGGMPAFYLSGIKNGYAWTKAETLIGNIHDNPELLGER
jgi:uncharacterized phage protein (TIGR01671 family)